MEFKSSQAVDFSTLTFSLFSLSPSLSFPLSARAEHAPLHAELAAPATAALLPHCAAPSRHHSSTRRALAVADAPLRPRTPRSDDRNATRPRRRWPSMPIPAPRPLLHLAALQSSALPHLHRGPAPRPVPAPLSRSQNRAPLPYAQDTAVAPIGTASQGSPWSPPFLPFTTPNDPATSFASAWWSFPTTLRPLPSPERERHQRCPPWPPSLPGEPPSPAFLRPNGARERDPHLPLVLANPLPIPHGRQSTAAVGQMRRRPLLLAGAPAPAAPARPEAATRSLSVSSCCSPSPPSPPASSSPGNGPRRLLCS